ncbi:asparagine synthase C-terminal domain-containing protein [Candidatus Woesearchaeota archaeon]|nr:asparagine synthase C-terminal domain-containing protein [Candidatus Woesearchaeota archaeon]
MKLPQTKQLWEKKFKKLQTEIELVQRTQEEHAHLLATAIEETILSHAKQARGNIGLLFSGGVDSTLIGFVLKKHNIPFIAVTVGFQDNEEQKLPDDIVEARKIGRQLLFDYAEDVRDFFAMEELFTKTTTILGKDISDAVNVGVGSVEVAAITTLIDHDVTDIFGGLGSEELFAGYLRHKQAENRHEECWNGLIGMFDRDMRREFAIANRFGVSVWAPFLDEALVRVAMSIPDEFKLSTTESKAILRDAAELLGLPPEMARRPKKAAQYGSRTDKALDKLAKKHGFKYKKEYIAYLIEHE